MKDGQEDIYYIFGEGGEKVLKNSPLLEKFKKRNYNVLILDDEVDPIVFPMVSEYDKTPMKSVQDVKFEDEKDDEETSEKGSKIIEKLSKVIADEVKTIRVSKSLVDAPVCIVPDKDDQNYMMAQIMKQMGQTENMPEVKPILEINPNHQIFEKLLESEDETLNQDIAVLLLEQARIFNGDKIKDSVDFIQRVNRIMVNALK